MKKIVALFLFISLLACEEILYEEDISKTTIELLAPTDAATLQNNEKIGFSWQVLAGAEYYHLQIARPSFETAVQIELDSVVIKNSFSLDSLKANNYEWRVKGLNSAYETGYSLSGFVVEE